MMIDFHTHTFPGEIAARALRSLSAKAHMDPALDGTREGLMAAMARAQVDLAVVLPTATSPEQVRSINRTAAKQNGEGGPLLSFAAMHPDLPEWEAEMEQIRADGFKGIKLHAFYQKTDQDDPKYIQIIKKAEELGLITLVHAGDDVGNRGHCYCSPAMCRRVMDKTGAKRMVFAHMGGWHHFEEAAELLSPTGCYIDTAFCTTPFAAWDDGYHDEASRRVLAPEEFVDILDLFGARYILFGTDSPWISQEADIAWIRALPLSDNHKQMILGDNAAELLQL